MLFYERLKELCEEKGVKLTNLVKELDMSQGNLSKWKKGGIPKADTLSKLANYFDVTTDYLLGNKPFRTREEESDAFEVTSSSAVERMVEWLEDHGYEVGCNDNDNGSAVEWYITKNGQTQWYEENQFRTECVALAELAKNPEDVIYADWIVKQFTTAEQKLSDDLQELIEIYKSLDRHAVHEFMAFGYRLQKESEDREKTKETGTSISTAG